MWSDALAIIVTQLSDGRRRVPAKQALEALQLIELDEMERRRRQLEDKLETRQ